MAKIEITKTELVWPGKYNEDGTRKEVPRVSLPFQVIETINESRATRQVQKTKSLAFFAISCLNYQSLSKLNQSPRVSVTLLTHGNKIRQGAIPPRFITFLGSLNPFVHIMMGLCVMHMILITRVQGSLDDVPQCLF